MYDVIICRRCTVNRYPHKREALKDPAPKRRKSADTKAVSVVDWTEAANDVGTATSRVVIALDLPSSPHDDKCSRLTSTTPDDVDGRLEVIVAVMHDDVIHDDVMHDDVIHDDVIESPLIRSATEAGSRDVSAQQTPRSDLEPMRYQSDLKLMAYQSDLERMGYQPDLERMEYQPDLEQMEHPTKNVESKSNRTYNANS